MDERGLGTGVTDPGRLRSLRATGLLDSPPEEAFDRLTRLASKMVGAPTALISLVDEDRQFFKSALGLRPEIDEARETPLSHSYCQHVVNSGLPLTLDDARENELTRESLAIPDLDAISYCGVPIKDEDGNVLGSFCVLDSQPRGWTEEQVTMLQELAEMVMTEIRLRKLARDLDKANGHLKDVNQALRDFISVASHDMKNPLTSILGFSSMMKRRWESFSDQEKRKFAGTIESQALFLNRLVDDLLTLSQVEAGAIEVRPEVLNVLHVVEHVVGTLAEDVTVDIDVSTGEQVLADADHFQRIITNLLSNALKYGAQPVTIRAMPERDSVRVEIEDRGQGVSPEFLPRLFQRFSRAEDENTRTKEGTGLGLSIVRALAESSGGSVSYEPNVPKGSRFVVRLPAG